MARKSQWIAVAATLLFAGTLPVAWAQTTRLQQARTRKLKACVGLIPSLGEYNAMAGSPSELWNNPMSAADDPDPDAANPARSPDPNPYLFYVLDQRKDVKPDGWEISNPAATQSATLAQSLRWATITGNVSALPQGTPLKPDMAAYWEVAINQSNFERLLEMDVIYIPVFRVPTRFTEEQRRILTRLADAGVVIWVDWARTGINAIDGTASGATATAALRGGPPNEGAGVPLNPFFTNVDFLAGGGQAVPILPGDPIHPLLNSQFYLKSDATQIGSYNGASAGAPLKAVPSQDRAITTSLPGFQANANVAPVVGTTIAGGAYIGAAQFGAGYVVATAGNVGGAISTLTARNSGAMLVPDPIISAATVRVSSQDLQKAEPEDLKFAYNVFALATEVNAPGKNSRRIGQTNLPVTSMLEQANYPALLPAAAGTPWPSYPTAAGLASGMADNPASPVIVNGMVITPSRYRNAGGTLVSELNAFEINPNNDFDANGTSDDQYGDYSLGQPYDRVMTIGPDTLPAGIPNLPLITGLTVGWVPDYSGASYATRPFVFVAGAAGGPSTGLFSLPAPRANAVASDYWSAGNVSSAPAMGVAYTGAPGFATIPGPISGGSPTVNSVLLAGGVNTQPFFGSANNGKLVSFNISPTGAFVPGWYYPANQESNRLGKISGPVAIANIMDQGTGAIDTMAIVTSVSSGDPNAGQQGAAAGDTTGKAEGFIIATKGDVLGFPRGNNGPGGNNPSAGRRFVCERWLDIAPGTGQVPQNPDLIWDISRHVEIRVMDRETGYVLLKWYSGNLDPNFRVYGANSQQLPRLLTEGTAGQIELPVPPPAFAVPGNANVWDLNRFVLLADYSPLPQTVDQTGATIRPRFSPATPYFRGVQQVVEPTGVAGGAAVGKDNLVYYGTGRGYMCASEWNKGRSLFRWKARSLEFGAAGFSTDVDPTSAAYLQDYAFVAAPAAGSRIVFASRQTAYIWDPDATIRFKLNGVSSLTAAQAQDVMLQGDHGLALPNNQFILSTQQPWGRFPNQFSVDADNATITFNNMENFSLDLQQARSPQYMASIGIDTGGRPAVPILWAMRGNPVGFPSTTSPAVAWIPLPLVAIYRPNNGVGEQWLSGASLGADRAFMMSGAGYLHEIPLDPKSLEPSFPRAVAGNVFGYAGLAGFDIGQYGASLRKRREVFAFPGGGIQRVNPTPAIAPGMVAVNSMRGLTMYGAPNVVVSDSNRIVEASGSSTAVASTDVTVKHRIDRSEFAIPTDPSLANTGGFPILTEKKLLNRPAKAIKLNRNSSLTSIFSSTSPGVAPIDDVTGVKETTEWADESYLAADTGNNRAVEFNSAGKVIWECSEIQDPLGLLPAGESLKLSGPQDVQRWIELESTAAYGDIYVIHTLIADTGNTRVLEVVDKVRYQRGVFTPDSYPYIQDGSGTPSATNQVGADGSPIRWYHVLVWTSQSNAQGYKFRYRTAQRIFWPDRNGNLIPTGVAANNRVATPFPPYLPPEKSLTTTMAAVNGQKITYPPLGVADRLSNYNQFRASPSQTVLDRKPDVSAGGDTIVFLRGMWKVDESSGPGTPALCAYREARVGTGIGADTYRFDQGVVDPNIRPISLLWDDAVFGSAQALTSGVKHTLSGIASVQRTIRSDVKMAPETFNGTTVPPRQYFLVADSDGVWEFRMQAAPINDGPDPGPIGNTTGPLHRLCWALTNEDYGYVTGAGNGDPAQLLNPAAQTPGGRILSASSARRLPSGLVLITNRTPTNELPINPNSGFNRLLHAGADVFLLQPGDFRTALERGSTFYDRANLVQHGWRPDRWVQNVFNAAVTAATLNGPPSIRWRASEQFNVDAAPTLRGPLESGGNPLELTGTYNPVQPTYADLVY